MEHIAYKIKFVGVGRIGLGHEDDLLLSVLIGQSDEGLMGGHDGVGRLVPQLELHDEFLVMVCF